MRLYHVRSAEKGTACDKPSPAHVSTKVSRLADADARPIAMILDLDFPDQAALDVCLASSIQPESHAATVEVMKLFEGRFYHLVAEAKVLDPA